MDLSDEEINHICSGYVQNAAKVRFLQNLGLTVRRKPNGKPLVNRRHYNTIMTSGQTIIKSSKNSQYEPVWGVH